LAALWAAHSRFVDFLLGDEERSIRGTRGAQLRGNLWFGFRASASTVFVRAVRHQLALFILRKRERVINQPALLPVERGEPPPKEVISPPGLIGDESAWA